MNDDWQFRFSHQVNRGDARRVDLPHTWNAQDALAGRPDYKRGIGNYTKRLYVRPEWAGKRLFLRFEGANSIADLFVDGRHVGEHRGGYGAFVFEITDRVECGREHTIEVRVNNGEQLDVMPLVGDFNFYGGIYRDVHLLVTDSLCISPLDCASPGLFLVQQSVDERRAEVSARIELSSAADRPQPAVVRLRIADGERTVYEAEKEVVVAPHATAQQERIDFALEHPGCGTVRPTPSSTGPRRRCGATGWRSTVWSSRWGCATSRSTPSGASCLTGSTCRCTASAATRSGPRRATPSAPSTTRRMCA